MATVYVGCASIDENGNACGGVAGNQSGRELRKQVYYVHKKGWRVFRARDPAVAAAIARCMSAAIANRHIGYDQRERNSLYKYAGPFRFDVSKVVNACETDCSALVRVCCAYAGVVLPDFNTTTQAARLLNSGAFVELTGSKYQSQSLYLGAGDILVTKTQGHTVVVLNEGSKYEGTVYRADYALGGRIVRYGCEGSDVKLLQESLISLNYDLGIWGADGDFGDCTELAVRAFQTMAGIEVDGEVGPITLEALSKALDALNAARAEGATVTIAGGDCFIRTAPNTDGAKLGVAKRGTILPYGGQTDDSTGWLLVQYTPDGSITPVNGWVSGMYGRLSA